MNLKFWKRSQSKTNGSKSDLPRPKQLPDQVGIYMVTHLKEDPDWVWTLRVALRRREENRRVHDMRIFDPREARERHIVVENFDSLDNHPELVLYSGSLNKDTGTVQLEKASQAAA